MLIEDIAARVKETRRAQGLTQLALAERAKVSRPTIARLETGKLPEIGYRTLLKILRALDLDLRLTTLNKGRPTLDDLARGEEEL